MLSEDYLIRMINQMVAVLAQVSGLKRAGKYQEAHLAVRNALEQLFGLGEDLLERLDDESLLKMLNRQGQLDTERVINVADLWVEDGNIYAVQVLFSEWRVNYCRALFFYLEAGFADNPPRSPVELTRKITEVVQKLGIDAVPEDILWTLFCYAEKVGAYADANAALIQLAQNPQTQAEIRSELQSFYQRLLEKTPAELTQGKLSRSDVQRSLAAAK